MTTKEFCQGNQEFQQLLEKFSESYIDPYNKRKVALRNEIMKYLPRNYSNWYYSPMDDIGGVSPARFINSHVYNRADQDAVAFPVCKPDFKKSRLSGITFDFHVFNLENHPFLNDMRLFPDFVRSHTPQNVGKKLKGMGSYMLTNADFFLEQDAFTFRERIYLMTLGEVCEGLGMVQLSQKKGGMAVTCNEERISEFFAQPARTQMERVIVDMVERFADAINSLKIPDLEANANDIPDLLKEGLHNDDFFESLFHGIAEDLEDFLDYLEFGIDDDDDEITDIEAGKIEQFAGLVSTCCRYFFIPFGLY